MQDEMIVSYDNLTSLEVPVAGPMNRWQLSFQGRYRCARVVPAPQDTRQPRASKKCLTSGGFLKFFHKVMLDERSSFTNVLLGVHGARHHGQIRVLVSKRVSRLVLTLAARKVATAHHNRCINGAPKMST